MSFFNVTVEEIEEVNPIKFIENDKEVTASSIEQATLKGKMFSFIIGKGSFSPGDKCLYFPLDSVIPNDLAEKLGVLGKLSKSHKNVVSTRAFKGVISQGLVGKTSILQDYGVDINSDPDKITEALKVIKYEIPEIPIKNGRIGCFLPNHLNKYDIESAQRNKEILDILMDIPVVVMEKCEGQNHCISFDYEKKETVVCSRTRTIYPLAGTEGTSDEVLWWQVPRRQGYVEVPAVLAERYNSFASIYSEQVGPTIQGNLYKLPKVMLYTFDIKVNDKFLGYEEFKAIVKEFKLNTAPILSEGLTLREYLTLHNHADIIAASHGQSAIATDVLREGIVIKPIDEQYIAKFGRLILKVRDPIYLAKTGN